MKSTVLPLCGLMFALASPLPATQFIPLSIDELTAKADLIVHGTVGSKTSARDFQGRIFTRVELAVNEFWKGRPSTNLNILLSGGILGEEAAVVPGQADYEIGEEVVVFLALNPRGEPVTLGLAQGKFHLWQDAATGEKLARNLFHGRGRQQAARPGGPLTLAELKREVLKGSR